MKEESTIRRILRATGLTAFIGTAGCSPLAGAAIESQSKEISQFASYNLPYLTELATNNQAYDFLTDYASKLDCPGIEIGLMISAVTAVGTVIGTAIKRKYSQNKKE